jgi:hypothetical protein
MNATRRIRRLFAAALLMLAPAGGAAAQTAPEELAPVKDVLAALEKKDYAKARTLAEDLKDPLHKKALRWRLAQVKDVPYGFAELADIYRGAKDWPGALRIADRADDAIGNGDAAETVLAWFKDAPPRGARDWSTYIATLARAGKEGEARDAAQRAWATLLIPPKGWRAPASGANGPEPSSPASPPTACCAWTGRSPPPPE